MSNEFLVQLDAIEKSFHTRHFFKRDEDTNRRSIYTKRHVHAAKSINFGVGAGEIFGLLGPNGAGKTTTVKMISGLVRPDRGAVYVNGDNVEKKRRQILRNVGVVLEGTRTSIWPLTPLENLIYYGNLKNVRGKHLKRRAHELLDFIGLADKKYIQVRYLSRGQKQKLAICIALIADPMVLLLDEPTTGLDVQSARAIKDKIHQMTKEHGRCVLVTTHDMHVAQELCDRIGIINNGELITCKPTEELIEVFSDHVYLFKLDRAPEMAALENIPGVASLEIEENGDGPQIIAGVSTDPAERSEALYTLTERLRAQNLQLRAINQRQQNLEAVFLKLTAKK